MYVTNVRVDRRSRGVRAAPAAEQRARDALRKLKEAEVEAAQALVELHECRAFIPHGYASLHSWVRAETGDGPDKVDRLLRLGRSFKAAPELIDKVRSGAVPTESAISVGKVLCEPELDLTEEQKRAWARKAERAEPRAVKDEAEQAVQDARQGAPTIGMRFQVTKECRDDFRRVRVLLSRGAERMLSDGQALARISREYLERNDPEERPDPGRRSEHTAGTPGRRIPNQVKAHVERRSGGTCEICKVRRATQKIHIVPHSKGGSREVDNIVDACSDCHVFVDARIIRFTHFDADGHPCWAIHPERLQTSERERGPPG